MSQQEKATLLRELPSTDELLTAEPFAAIAASSGHSAAVRIARSSIGELRQIILDGGNRIERTEFMKTLAQFASDILARESSARVNRVNNATGVVIHTNLGRSVLSENAVEAIRRGSGYCTLEYDRISGTRGKRGGGAEALLCELTGAEAAVIVNNCAAAAFLVLRVLARGKEVVISRGELVEIGGDFRVPDELVESGAIL